MSFTYILAPSPTPGTPPEKIIPSTEWLNEHTGGNLIAVSVAFMVLTALFVGLRFWSRRLQQSSVGLDDYLIYPALAACWISEATCIAIVPKGGVGTRLAYWELANEGFMLKNWAIYLYAVEMCYLLAACMAKLAILAIYLRVLRDSLSRKVTHVLVAVTIATWIAESVACSVQCIPFEAMWDKTIPGGHCFDQLAFYIYLSIPNLLTDLILLLLPIPTIWHLQANKLQKIQLSIAFLTGSFGIVASILRLAGFFMTPAFADPTFNSSLLLTWTVIEPAMYLISACLPTLRPLLNKCLEKLGVRTTTTRGDSAGGYESNRMGNNMPSISRTRQWVREHSSDDEAALKGSSDHALEYSSNYPEPWFPPEQGQIVQTSDLVVTRSKRRW